MALSGTYPNLIGGISQQPASIRLENTCSDSLNDFLSVVGGRRKRPSSIFEADLGAAPSGTVAQFYFDRGGSKGRLVTIEGGTLRVFRKDGTSEPVSTVGSSSAYLASADPESDFRFMAIEDTVFVLNRGVTVGRSTPADARRVPTADMTFVIEAFLASTTYELSVNGTVRASHTTGTSGSVDTVAQALLSALTAPYAVANGATRYGNVISVPTQASTDTPAGNLSTIRAYRDRIFRFTNLPPRERPNRLIQVADGPESTNDEAYWVQFNATDGLWYEALGPGAGSSLDAATLPHTLTDNADGTWTLQPWTWSQRIVGDAATNPDPSFVGQTLNDLFLFEDRMTLLSRSNYVQSGIGDYSNFFRTTVTQLLRADRIDLAATSPEKKLVNLHAAFSFNDTLLLFSDGIQFKVTPAGDGSSDKRTTPTTLHTSTALCRPTALGRNVAFADDVPGTNWAAIREYFVSGDNGEEDTDPLTKQVPQLIPSGVYQIVSHPSLDVAFVATRGDRSTLYPYFYFWGDKSRLQSAWTKWKLGAPGEFAGGGFLDKTFYFLYVTDGRLNLMSMALEETVAGDIEGLDFLVDFRVSEDRLTLSEVGGSTFITFPYVLPSDSSVAIAVRVDGSEPAGTTFIVPGNGTNTIMVDGFDLTGDLLFAGLTFNYSYTLSPPVIRDQKGVPIQDGRFQVLSVSLQYHQASYFQVVVRPKLRRPSVKTFAGRDVGDGVYLGVVPVKEGRFRVPVLTEASQMNVTIESDSPFDARFSSIDWEGKWRPRSRRVT